MIRSHIAPAALALSLCVPAAQAQIIDGPKVEWKLAAWGKPRAVTAGFELLAKQVSERTGGKFNITIGWGTFGGERELLDILNAGGLQATLICSSYHPDKLPAYSALDLPFLPLPSLDVQWAVHEAFNAHPYVVQEMGKWNAMLYSANLLPQYEFVGRGTPPKTLADF